MDSNISLCANSIFEQPWWLDVVCRDKWKEIIIKENDVVVGRWPIVFEGNDIIMPQLTQTIGFWISDQIILNDRNGKKQREIICQLLDQLPYSVNVKVKLDSSVKDFMPMIWKGYSVSPFVSYRLNDLSSWDNISSKFSTNVKKTLKRAHKGLVVEHSNDVEKIFQLVDKTFNKRFIKNPLPEELIREIYTTASKYNSCHLLYAKDKNGIIHSGSIFVYDSNVFYHLVSGTDPMHKSSGAATLLITEGIKLASKTSCCFDFEGSMIEGINRFYSQFGADQMVYYQISKKRDSFFKMHYQRGRSRIRDIYRSIIFNKSAL